MNQIWHFMKKIFKIEHQQYHLIKVLISF